MRPLRTFPKIFTALRTRVSEAQGQKTLSVAVPLLAALVMLLAQTGGHAESVDPLDTVVVFS